MARKSPKQPTDDAVSFERTVRMKDVADAAGVSHMTVSLALRNHRSISQKTRKRIRELADAMGYRPDPNISNLMARVRSKKPTKVGTALAYLTDHDTKRGWEKSPTQRNYYAGARQRANALGYHLDEFWLKEEGMTEAGLSRVLKNRGLDGVIIAPLQYPGSSLNNFQWEHFSVVQLGYSLASPILHRCCNHQFQSMMLLLDHLTQRGYRRPGLAMAPGQDERVNHHWSGAFFATQNMLMGTVVDAIPTYLGTEQDWNLDTFRQWLEENTPDVIVTVGRDIQSWLAQLGLKTPTDVALANADLDESMPDVTGIDQKSPQVGTAAIDLLLSLMRTGERGVPDTPRTLMVDGVFVRGRTA